ncbi:MAG TPA: BadF/BadG/BcrA/BcrD ATPase family protein [Edaphobacter sp.]|uniref:N-acetylglucosamine kinase n=1 Tax=Edaphobacter sp. TaxID=1934404 RepID=UPI002CB1DEAA|nr:BadF/BadG/BcrA/BcrD ATPase family protein [Edaphobacter sp.]HUZ94793.1 BadF/BadG/BcrA/BcrD ATPase family protein [Edaphobacter sp.]
MAYFIGIDAGGTKTRCVLADETKVLGRADCGSIKLMRVGEAEATARLRRLLEESAAAAGVSLQEVTGSCVGIGGVSIPAVRQWCETQMKTMVSGEVEVCGDEDIALDAAFHGGPGILVVSGTGSIFIGRSADGTMYPVGGWGPVLADEGSGWWIGLEAVRAGFWAKDRGIKTDLLTEVQNAWELSSLGELVEKGNDRPGPDFAALVPLVVRCAESGDEMARAVLERAGADLAELITLVAVKMMETSGESEEPIGVAYVGSILEHVTIVRQTMIAALAESAPQTHVLEGAVNSLEGALWRARTAAGLISVG